MLGRIEKENFHPIPMVFYNPNPPENSKSENFHKYNISCQHADREGYPYIDIGSIFMIVNNCSIFGKEEYFIRTLCPHCEMFGAFRINKYFLIDMTFMMDFSDEYINGFLVYPLEPPSRYDTTDDSINDLLNSREDITKIFVNEATTIFSMEEFERINKIVNVSSDRIVLINDLLEKNKETSRWIVRTLIEEENNALLEIEDTAISRKVIVAIVNGVMVPIHTYPDNFKNYIKSINYTHLNFSLKEEDYDWLVNS